MLLLIRTLNSTETIHRYDICHDEIASDCWLRQYKYNVTLTT